MTDANTIEEIRSLPWADLECNLPAVLALAETDDLSMIVNSLILVDRDLLPATLTAHVKRSRPELLSTHGATRGGASASKKRKAEPLASNDADADFDEVSGLCVEREEHRKSSNFLEADRVRNRLQAMGVQLDDKRHIFTMPDGSQGSYDLYHAGGGGGSRAPLPPASRSAPARQHAPPAAIVGGAALPPVRTVSHRGYAFALERAMEREGARKDNDFVRADALRDELAAEGVEINDKQHMFTTRGGLQGTYNLQKGMGIHEVRLCCLDREESRKEGDYQTGDRIRDQLVAIGVAMDDKTHVFQMPDGRTGSYDLHGPAAIGPGQPAAPRTHQPVLAPLVPARDGDFAEIERICLQRERTRRDGDYKSADRLRHELNNMGVALEDKTHTFTLRDGRKGNYDLHAHESGAGHQASAQPVVPQAMHGAVLHPQYAHQYAQVQYGQPLYVPGPPPYGQAIYAQPVAHPAAVGVSLTPPPLGNNAPGTGFSGYLHVFQATRRREEVRRNRDYREADRLRDDLKRMGVECEDAAHKFIFRGLEGSYDLRSGLSKVEVQYICLEREEARRDRDYPKSDAVRDWLSSQGVQLEDKTHTWTMSDGSTGTYDLKDFR